MRCSATCVKRGLDAGQAHHWDTSKAKVGKFGGEGGTERASTEEALTKVLEEGL
jgi:hypothetical protein